MQGILWIYNKNILYVYSLCLWYMSKYVYLLIKKFIISLAPTDDSYKQWKLFLEQNDISVNHIGKKNHKSTRSINLTQG